MGLEVDRDDSACRINSTLLHRPWNKFVRCLSCCTRRVDNSESTATSNPFGTTVAVFTKLPRPLAKDRKSTLVNWRPI